MTDNESIKRKKIATQSKRGLLILSLRTAITNVLQFISSISLARLLTPYDYGVFGILNGWISSLSYLTDIGLHESLVQQKSDISINQMKSYLSIRIILSVSVSIFFGISFIFLKSYYNFKSDSLGLYFLGLITIFEAFSTIPKIHFQKNLNFIAFSKIELISTVFLYIGQVLFAYLGFGFWSFFIGIILRQLTIIASGFYLKMYHVPSFTHLQPIFSNLKKGVFYQINLIIIALNAIFIPIILKLFLDVDTIGLYFWTNGLVSIPLVFINNYNNVLFPAIAKLQSNREQIKILITRGGEVLILAIGLIFGLGAALGPSLIDILFNERWYAAKSIIALISLTIGLYGTRNIINSLLSGIGNPFMRSKIELINFFLVIGLTYILAQQFQLFGFLYAQTIANFTILIIASIYAREYIQFDLIKRFIIVFSGALLANYLLYNFKLVNNIFISFLIFMLVFFPFCVLLDRKIIIDLQQIFHKIKSFIKK